MEKRVSIASCLFLIGSLMFLFDGFLQLKKGISLHILLYIFASFLFVVGSYLFIPTK